MACSDASEMARNLSLAYQQETENETNCSLFMKVARPFGIVQKAGIKLPKNHRSVEFSIMADFLQLLD